MSIQMLFHSTATAQVDITGGSISHIVVDPSDASCSYSLTSAGNEVRSPGSSTVWLLSGAAGDYDVMATVVSGTVSSGTTGSWLNLGTTRSWTRTRAAPGTSAVQLTIEIRRVSDSVVIDTASVDMTAEVTV